MTPSKWRIINRIQNGLPEALLDGIHRVHGFGNSIPTAQIQGTGESLVGVGTKVYRGQWRTFTTFLLWYLTDVVFEREWWLEQEARPQEQRHPIVRQLARFKEVEKNTSPDPSGIYSVIPDPMMRALVALAYDLYLSAHNFELPKALVSRLKQPREYEGALYEARLIGAFAQAGYALVFEDNKGGASHGEFIARNRSTGKAFHVEAKAVTSASKRSGRSSAPPAFADKLHDALKKETELERIVFIELNQIPDSGPEAIARWLRELESQKARCEREMTVKGVPAPPAYVYVTNRPAFVDGIETAGPNHVLTTGFKISDYPPERGATSILSMHDRRMKHIEAYHLYCALVRYESPPSRFPGDAFSTMIQASEMAHGSSMADHPLNFFDFNFDIYSKTQREKLLDWLTETATENLRPLPTVRLAEMLCAGYAGAFWREHSDPKSLVRQNPSVS